MSIPIVDESDIRTVRHKRGTKFDKDIKKPTISTNIPMIDKVNMKASEIKEINKIEPKIDTIAYIENAKKNKIKEEKKTTYSKEKSTIERKKAFIETKEFPVAPISQASAKEKKGGGRPDYWEMVFWWTRKPLISARSIITGGLLPEDIDPMEFKKFLMLDQKVPHNYNPVVPERWFKYFKGKKLLDPFAGFGSIPLEASRLGLSATAIELLPTAYIFLKSILEYPSEYGEKLIKDVDKWGNWVTDQLKNDAVVKQLYDEDVFVYIGTWEIKCPHCDKWTPLIGNFWLADTEKRKAWMTVSKNIDKDGISISIEDTNNIGNFDKINKQVPVSNIKARSDRAICLNCNGIIRYVDRDTGRHYLESKKLPKEITQRLQWYVKYAIGKFNNGDSRLARQKLLIKVKKNKNLYFEYISDKDNRSLETASREIDKLISINDQDIPMEPLAPYGTKGGGILQPINYEMKKWFQVFNPRQLFVLIKITKLIREVGALVEQEKLNLGFNQEDAKKYAGAIVSYLSMALCKYADYNSLTTRWNPKWLKFEESLGQRGLTMMWNWVDCNPFAKITGSWTRSLESIINGLDYLNSAINRNYNTYIDPIENSKSRAMLDDASFLRTINSEDKFDLIVTDPPFYNDIPYAELSDFYYVWLKRGLSEVKNNRLIPRFICESFFKKIEEKYLEIRTQWEEFASREVSIYPMRPGIAPNSEEKHFQNLLDASFSTMESLLKDDGMIITYYAHTDPEAWKALLKSGWQGSNLTVSNAFPISTEFSNSVVKRGKLSLDTSIVVVWRKGASGSIQASKLYDQMIESSKVRILSLIEMKILGRDLFVASLAAALSEATKYNDIIEMKKLETTEIMDRYILRAALYGLTKAISQNANIEEGVKSNEGMFYLVIKFLYTGYIKKVVTTDDARIFSLGTGIDLSYLVDELKIFRHGKEEEEGDGSSLAKRKTLILLEPQIKDRIKLKELLDYRGIGTETPIIRCSIDALHVLEYYGLTYSRDKFLEKLNESKINYPSEVDEAISLARVISSLVGNDVEKDLCGIVIEKIGDKIKTE